jgi:hypothetical protein
MTTVLRGGRARFVLAPAPRIRFTLAPMGPRCCVTSRCEHTTP